MWNLHSPTSFIGRAEMLIWFLLFLTTTCDAFERKFAIVRNDLDGGKKFTIHCQSADNDIGVKVLPPTFSFKFNFTTRETQLCLKLNSNEIVAGRKHFDTNINIGRLTMNCKLLASIQIILYYYKFSLKCIARVVRNNKTSINYHRAHLFRWTKPCMLFWRSFDRLWWECFVFTMMFHSSTRDDVVQRSWWKFPDRRESTWVHAWLGCR